MASKVLCPVQCALQRKPGRGRARGSRRGRVCGQRQPINRTLWIVGEVELRLDAGKDKRKSAERATMACPYPAFPLLPAPPPAPPALPAAQHGGAPGGQAAAGQGGHNGGGQGGHNGGSQGGQIGGGQGGCGGADPAGPSAPAVFPSQHLGPSPSLPIAHCPLPCTLSEGQALVEDPYVSQHCAVHVLEKPSDAATIQQQEPSTCAHARSAVQRRRLHTILAREVRLDVQIEGWGSVG